MWGGLLVEYFFQLRRSEYLFIGAKHHGYILRLGNVRILDQSGHPSRPRQAAMVGFTLTGAKNNQYGREEVRYHHKSQDKVICPVRAARWIHKAAAAFGTRSDMPAMATGSGGISSHELAALIKRGAAAAGLDATRYSTHSVRIGGATALLNAGADRLTIKLMGWWLSNAFEAYPVLSAEGSADLARLMC